MAVIAGAGGGAGAGKLGFDLEKADELVSNIGDTWRSIVLYERDAFKEVQKVLQEEWVGPDEQQFEQVFTIRLRKLYDMTEETVSQASAAIATYASTWAEWQANQNKLEGIGIAEAGADDTNIVDDFIGFVGKATPTIHHIIDIRERIKSHVTANVELASTVITAAKNWIKGVAADAAADYEAYLTFVPKDYDTGFRGLVNGTSSATKIQSSVEKFVGDVRTKTQNLFDSISVTEAFYGSQTTAVKGYITNASDCVEDISTAVKDLNDALTKVAGSNYAAQQELAVQNINAAKQNMSDTTANSIANSKWD